MTTAQTTAEARIAPAVSKRTQRAAILAHIAEFGFITPWAAIHTTAVHCTKVSTRIGEIERRCGHRFTREMQYWTDAEGRRHPLGMRYSIPEGLTIDDFRCLVIDD